MQLLDLLLPQRCLVCARSGELICAACRGGLPRLRAPLCARCGAPVAWPVERCLECAGRRLAFASARAAVRYDDDGVRSLVAGWKQRGLRGLAELAADLVVDELPRPGAAAIAFVAADRDRRLERGHHPAARLAVELGERWELPVLELLRRTRAVRPQRGLARAERRRNVRGSFAAADDDLPRSVVLVDDVYTTGATASAAASALRAAGVRRIDVVTFARAVRA